MFSRIVIDYPVSMNVVRMKIISDATTWSVAYDRQNDDRNIFIIQATEWLSFTLSGIYTAETIHTSNSALANLGVSTQPEQILICVA